MSAIIKNIKINRHNAGKAAALNQLYKTIKSIFETSGKIFGTIGESSVNSSRSSVNSNRSSVNSRRSSVNSGTASDNSNTASVKNKLFFNKTNHTLKQISKSPEFNEIISNADEYLHYANEILFCVSNTSVTLNLILFRISSSGHLTGIIIIIFKNADKPVFFICRIENAKIFDGVIERYCGVPP